MAMETVQTHVQSLVGSSIPARQSGEQSEHHSSFELFHQEPAQKPLMQEGRSATPSMQWKDHKFPELRSSTFEKFNTLPSTAPKKAHVALPMVFPVQA